MPYDVGVGAIMELTIRGEIAGQTTLNILHYMLAGGTYYDGKGLLTDAVGVLDEEDGLLERLCDATTSDYLIRGVTGQWIFPVRYVVTPVPIINNQMGRLPKPCLPSSSSVVITKKSDNVAGRSGVGAVHFAGAAQASTTTSSSVLDNAGKLLWDGVANRVAAPMIGTQNWNAVPVIYHRADASLSQAFSTAITQPTIRTMRRRVVGRGV